MISVFEKLIARKCRLFQEFHELAGSLLDENNSSENTSISFFAFQLFRHSCSLRELSQVRGTSFSGGEGITLLPAISCKFCNPNGSCIEQSGIEPSPSGAFQHTASRQPAHRPVTQDAGSAPHDDKRPTRFVGRSLKYSLFLASEAIDKQK